MQILSNLRIVMTVEELIARLQKCNPKATVVSTFDASFYEIDHIYGKSFSNFKKKSIYDLDDEETYTDVDKAQTIILDMVV